MSTITATSPRTTPALVAEARSILQSFVSDAPAGTIEHINAKNELALFEEVATTNPSTWALICKAESRWDDTRKGQRLSDIVDALA